MMKKVAKYIKRHILISLAIGIIFVGLFMPRKVLAQSSDKIELIHSNPRLNGWGNTVWDIISFGKYQSVNATEEIPIQWAVMERKGNEVLLLGFECPLSWACTNSDSEVIWEQNSMRKWLNTDFYQKAFTKEEQQAILSSSVITNGKKTSDKVFIPSEEEMSNQSYGFLSDNDRLYMLAGKYMILRTQADSGKRMKFIHLIDCGLGDGLGVIDQYGFSIAETTMNDCYTLPMIRVNLSKTDAWQYLGQYQEGQDYPENSIITYDNTFNSFLGYGSFKEIPNKFRNATAATSSFQIPGLGGYDMVTYENKFCDCMVPQGVTVVGQYVFVSTYCALASNGNKIKKTKDSEGYSLTHHDNKTIHNSMIHVLDRKTKKLVLTMELYNNVNGEIKGNRSHVGALAYNPDAKEIYVADSENNCIWRIAYKRVKDLISWTRPQKDPSYPYTTLLPVKMIMSDNIKTEEKPSFLTYYGNKLWVGQFAALKNEDTKKEKKEKKEASYVAAYEVNGKTGHKKELIYVPLKTQGVAFFSQNGSEYMITSNSYGRKSPSELHLYRLNTMYKLLSNPLIKSERIVGSELEFPNMLEDIDLHAEQGSLYSCYESAANYYLNNLDQSKSGKAKNPLDKIMVSDFHSLWMMFKSKKKVKIPLEATITEPVEDLVYHCDQNDINIEWMDNDLIKTESKGENEVLSQGDCGKHLYYVLDGAGNLNITGRGNMEDYTSSKPPWGKYKSKIKNVYLGAEVESISANAFQDATSLTHIYLSEFSADAKTFKIDGNIVKNCNALKAVILPNKHYEISDHAFDGASKEMEIRSDSKEIREYCAGHKIASHQHQYEYKETVSAKEESAGYDVYQCECGECDYRNPTLSQSMEEEFTDTIKSYEAIENEEENNNDVSGAKNLADYNGMNPFFPLSGISLDKLYRFFSKPMVQVGIILFLVCGMVVLIFGGKRK